MKSRSRDQRGLLITFEGSEGCGKSTQIKRLAARLRREGKRVLLLREPGGTRLGERVRHLLKFGKSGVGMTPEAELLLFSASRSQLVREKMLPALQRGEIILCDRFVDSTTVYQGTARGLSSDLIQTLNQFAIAGRKPDLTLVLDIDPMTGLDRARKKTRTLDRMESQKTAFYQRVRKGFLTLAKKEPRRVKVIPATQGIPEVSQLIWTHVERIL